MRFNLLGPLTVENIAGQPVPLPSAKQRTVLSALLLWPNEALAAADLITALWDADPPASAAANVRTYVLRLRRLLEEPGTPPRIAARNGGYLVRVRPDERDVERFDAAAERGRASLSAGDTTRARAELSEAAGLWRGEPLADVPPSPLLTRRIGLLRERRMLVAEDLAEATLRDGAIAEAVRLSRALLDDDPLRQRAWEQLMFGLYRLGDVPGALDAYRTARRVLVEQTGLDPGPRLQRLHDDILHHRDPVTTVSSRPAVHDLPPAVEPFVGRAAETAAILRDLHGDAGSVVALHGPGGVGKSALAVHVAHQLAARFPDGVLYLDLRGAKTGAIPVRPVDAIARLLRALGVPAAAVPSEEAEAAAAFRRHTAHRRLLLVLDNADSAAQVADLLPAGPAAAVITSRRHLATLPRGRHLAVEVLAERDAVELLGQAGAGQRIAADPGGARRVAELCGNLPLALRIAAARLASRPGWPLQAFVERLDDPARRLDELSYDDVGVRRTLRLGYEPLSEGGPHEQLCARAFRLVGEVPLAVVTVGATAALLGVAPRQAHEVLETLADQRLLEPRLPGRYELHDLLRILAGEDARARESAPERAAALVRLIESYAFAVEHATALLNGGWTPADSLPEPARPAPDGPWSPPWSPLPGNAAEVPAWLDAEQPNIAAAVTRASEIGGVATRPAVRLAWLSYALFWRGGAPAEAHRLIERSLAMTAALDLTTEHAVTLYYRAKLRQAGGDAVGAEADLRSGAQLAGRLGDQLRRSGCLDALGNLFYLRGDPRQAVRCHDQALRLRRTHGTPLHVAASLSNMADARFDAGRQRQALAGVREALEIARRINATGVEGAALAMLGQLEFRLGDAVAAQRTLAETIELTATTGDLPTQCEATLARCAVRLSVGRADAFDDATAARDLAGRIGDRYLRAVATHAMAVASGDDPRAQQLAAEAYAELKRLTGFGSPMYAAFFGP
ncbi:BTAD domain-containing putative transcriptional regulator [Hamadaea sp. NPDC051192]|uniref:AfsR/SARP family transcriptional regulator n=1 Tax=Hamadaea sp. NPDC051192 TaxID=3154940 RepID=UPI00343F6335